MRRWCQTHPVLFMAGYLVFYLAFFALLEHRVTQPAVLLHCRLDDLIPFCKYAVVPYFLWFAWVPATLLWLLARAPRQEFWRLCLPLFAGMTLSLVICALIPNGVDLRPASVPGDDIFARAVRWLYRTDTDTNVFPSIHVFNAVTVSLAYQRSSLLGRPGREWVRGTAHLLCAAIVLSTLLLRQHSVLDAMGGIALALALALALDRLAAARQARRAPAPAPANRRALRSL